MYTFEQQIRVLLEFRSMPAPVEVSVPFPVLRYLDKHAERRLAADGAVIYTLSERAFDRVCEHLSCRDRTLVAA